MRSSGGVNDSNTGGSALGGAIFDIVHILAYLVNRMSRAQFYLGFGHSVWSDSLLYFLLVQSIEFGGFMVKLQLIYLLKLLYCLLADLLLQLVALFQC